MRFTEIEHKFVVGPAFDLTGFRASLDAIGPARHTALRVRDRYFITVDGRARHYVLRHRFDPELHQLTIKSLASDPEVRDEINLDLGHHAGAQQAPVDAFVARMGIDWQGELYKDLNVWHFPDCEVVHYVATTSERSVCCVEFEAIQQASVTEALAVIGRYERATGFNPADRSLRPLLDLMFPGVLRPTW
ncbi:MAG: CYTH domain-containing protein [Elusimicrobia bacterium]|jgi:hypothetical protein|nr:CYTH domain-containing protein [Elusimicrobiota bacterium]